MKIVMWRNYRLQLCELNQKNSLYVAIVLVLWCSICLEVGVFCLETFVESKTDWT